MEDRGADPVEETLTVEQALDRERGARAKLEDLLERGFRVAPDERTLDERMAAVQAELDDVPRRGHAEVQTRTGGKYTYDYILEADLMSGVRPLLAKHGVATYYNDELIRWSDGTAEVRVTITFAAGGDQRECSAVGTGSDTGDKAANKAKTSAVRYILWKTFLQPSDEDPEQENVTTDQAAGAATARQTQRRASTSSRKTPEQRHGELVERISKLSIELDEVQGRTPGATLGSIGDQVRADHEAALGELADGELVKIGQALNGHLAEQRAKAEAGEETADGFEIPR